MGVCGLGNDCLTKKCAAVSFRGFVKGLSRNRCNVIVVQVGKGVPGEMIRTAHAVRILIMVYVFRRGSV